MENETIFATRNDTAAATPGGSDRSTSAGSDPLDPFADGAIDYNIGGGEPATIRKPRKPRQPRATAAEPLVSAPPQHTRAQVRGLAKSIGLTADGLFRIPCTIRTIQWGLMPDQNGMPIMKPDGDPMTAGEHWMLTNDEAADIGRAWAEVVALYAPPEWVERGGAVSAAVTVTGLALANRVFADMQVSNHIKAANMRRQEGLPMQPAPNAPIPNPDPNNQNHA
jgi:hypothetical protein